MLLVLVVYLLGHGSPILISPEHNLASALYLGKLFTSTRFLYFHKELLVISTSVLALGNSIVRMTVEKILLSITLNSGLHYLGI